MFSLIISYLTQALGWAQDQSNHDEHFVPVSMASSKMVFDDVNPIIRHIAQLPDKQREVTLLKQMGFNVDMAQRIQISLQALTAEPLSQTAYSTLRTISHELSHRLNQLSHIQSNTFNESSAVNENVLTALKEETRSKVIEEITRFGSAFKIEDESKKTVLKQTSTISGALPAVGEIVAFPYDPIPEGFLVCDGREVSREDYPELFNVISVTYGPGDAVNTFHLPDYRGIFLRGIDAGSGNDPNVESRTDRGDGMIGNIVGTKQIDFTKMPNHAFSISIQSSLHTHDLSLEGHHRHIISGQDNGASPIGAASNEVANVENYPSIFNRYSSYAGEHTHFVSGGAHSHAALISGGDMQTAPINVGIVYAIRAIAFDFSEAFASRVTLNNEIIERQADIATLNATISTTQDSIIEKDNAHQADIAALNTTISTTQDNIVERDHARQVEIAALNTTINMTQDNIVERDHACQAEIAALNTTISTTQDNIVEKDHARQVEIAALNTTISTTQDSIIEKDNAHQADIAALNTTISTTQDSIIEKDNAHQADITALNTTINMTQDNIVERDHARQADIATLNATISTTQDSIIEKDNARQADIVTLNTTIVEKDNAYQADIAALNTTISTTQDDIVERDHARQADITALNTTIQTAHRLLDQIEIQQSSNLAFFDYKIVQQTAMIEAVNDTLKVGFQDLRKVVQGLNISNIDATLNQLDATQSAAASNIIVLTQMLSDVTKKLGDNKVDDLVSELNESKSLIKNQNEMIQTLKKELETIKNKDSDSINDSLSAAAIALSGVAILGLMGVIYRQSIPQAAVLQRANVANAQM